MGKTLKYLPWTLIISRLIAGPLLILWVSVGSPSPLELLAVLIYAILSDIFDGIIARSIGVATVTMRRFDSQADLLFWVCVFIALKIHHPEIVSENWWAFGILIFLEGLCYLVSFIRFKKETCTHAISAKFYGLALFWAMGAMLAFGVAGWHLKVALALGIIANTDVIAIILLLPAWGSDIPSSYHAWRIRRGLPIKRNRLFN